MEVLHQSPNTEIHSWTDDQDKVHSVKRAAGKSEKVRVQERVWKAIAGKKAGVRGRSQLHVCGLRGSGMELVLGAIGQQEGIH